MAIKLKYWESKLNDPDYKVRLRSYRKINDKKHWIDALKDANEFIRLEAYEALDEEERWKEAIHDPCLTIALKAYDGFNESMYWERYGMYSSHESIRLMSLEYFNDPEHWKIGLKDLSKAIREASAKELKFLKKWKKCPLRQFSLKIIHKIKRYLDGI